MLGEKKLIIRIASPARIAILTTHLAFLFKISRVFGFYSNQGRKKNHISYFRKICYISYDQKIVGIQTGESEE